MSPALRLVLQWTAKRKSTVPLFQREPGFRWPRSVFAKSAKSLHRSLINCACLFGIFHNVLLQIYAKNVSENHNQFMKKERIRVRRKSVSTVHRFYVCNYEPMYNFMLCMLNKWKNKILLQYKHLFVSHNNLCWIHSHEVIMTIPVCIYMNSLIIDN